MYITEEMRQQVRMQHFRDALSGVKRSKSTEPDKRVSDFGVSEKVDIDNPGDFAPLVVKLAREDAISDALADGDHEAMARLEKEPAADEQEASGGNGVAALQKLRSGGAPTKIDRAEAVISRKASVETTYDYLERPRHDTFNTIAAHDAAMDEANNADPVKRDVNAVQMMMDNIFDWEEHDAHHGETMTAPMFLNLERSLRLNLTRACPVVARDEIFDHYYDLAANNGLGDFTSLKDTTRDVVEACLMAQNGDTEKLDKTRILLLGMARFRDMHYGDVEHRADVPLKIVARNMERNDARGATAPRPL